MSLDDAVEKARRARAAEDAEKERRTQELREYEVQLAQLKADCIDAVRRLRELGAKTVPVIILRVGSPGSDFALPRPRHCWTRGNYALIDDGVLARVQTFTLGPKPRGWGKRNAESTTASSARALGAEEGGTYVTLTLIGEQTYGFHDFYYKNAGGLVIGGDNETDGIQASDWLGELVFSHMTGGNGQG